MPSNDVTPTPPSIHDDQDGSSATLKALARDTEATAGTSDSFGVDSSELDIIPWS